MSEATDILRSYVRLVERLSGAASVSLYVPPGASGESEILLHDGRLDPVPELADAAAAALLHRRFSEESSGQDEGPVRLASQSPDGVLYRIPLRWVLSKEDDAAGPDRRKREGRPRAELTTWTGLRFDRDDAARRQDGLLYFPTAADTLSDDRWWKNFLGLAAAFAAHARTVSRTLFDQVTGLPERPEFQVELDAALGQAAEGHLPTALLLIGPDDFGWVNERLDRRSGDLVLREIATGLRASLRNHDHVARYGGAIFTVILVDTAPDVAKMVAENVVRRLGEHRYHGGILRLDFGAGVAVSDGTERTDGQELIRRADLALSAAKRDDASRVRVWEKGSDVENAGSLDRLQGIFTGDKSKDYRNMRLLLDTMAVVAASTDPTVLARSFTERLFETLHARRVGVFERSRAGSFDLLGGLERVEGAARGFQVTPHDLTLLERAAREHNLIAETGAQPGDLSLCALPLFLQDRCLGGIVLEVASANLSFEGSDRRFLDALASEMAVALDRARLIERERERQREEKERLEAEVTDLRRVLHGSRLAYRSPTMESLVATARKVAHTDTTVLITGESGTGKEMLAHTLHELSGRRDKQVVVVDCGAIAPTLIESELFGHEKGAFTGAHTRKPGRLAQAEGATVFLDEIGELPLDLQTKLLRFVQEKQFTPVGSVVARKVDVRIIAATNVDLRARVADGRFREDLFHRLNVVRLHVPPLRERREDILHLAVMFLQQFAALYRRPAHHFTPRAEAALEAYEWPGNVRELQNLIMTSVLFCDAAEVDVQDLHGFQSGPRPVTAAAESGPGSMAEAAPPPAPADEAAGASAPAGDPVVVLRSALAREIAAAVAGGRAGLVPLGKWLAEDLVLAADRLAAGVSRRGAELLGLPESTYRRQLQGAAARRSAGLAVRSPTWSGVEALLESFIRARRGDTDVCQWAEAGLLAEVETVAPSDPRTAAALLGVTQPTLLRRRAELSRHF
ncbi:MAG TPA: sigma 54-interacting transcriptional regulator [Vicinamibacteria bacterium]|nr:sigma 54-interacting transcriptional regulator [Vicinamibacteria bacterium]